MRVNLGKIKMLTKIILIDKYDYSRQVWFIVSHRHPMSKEDQLHFTTLAGDHQFEGKLELELVNRAKRTDILSPQRLWHNGIYVAEFLV